MTLLTTKERIIIAKDIKGNYIGILPSYVLEKPEKLLLHMRLIELFTWSKFLWLNKKTLIRIKRKDIKYLGSIE